jgi:hypothetical protein
MNSMYAAPPRIGYFHNEEKTFDKEAVSIKKGALVFADESGISISKEDMDEYSLLYLQFVFSYCFDVVLAYDALIFHVYNDYGHETCTKAETIHQLACAMVSLAVRSFVFQPEKKDGKVKEHKNTWKQI